ncbi:MAG: hypothetical protein RIC19_20510 [Phaeodactylibacter sp.]|uniref:hypothetical protein n=1 Tax=Phaeodactylibacter sp. TaxID=1940289 RepID=UPI0032ECEC61
MAFRMIAFCGLLGLILFVSACGCKEDEFGERMTLQVPVQTGPSKDTFQLGDTIWVEANFGKQVAVKDAASDIYLEDFDFFPQLSLSEISDTTEFFEAEVDFIEQIGQIETLPLATALVYPMQFLETDSAYQLRIGVVLKTEGLFCLTVYSSPWSFEGLNHPALFACGNNFRNYVNVHYLNSSTTKEQYEQLFLSTRVDYLFELISFEEYSSVAGHTFVVYKP